MNRADLWIYGQFLAAGGLVLGILLRFLPDTGEPTQTQWAPDPALVEDEQWAGIESEWHEFIDSFGVAA